MKISDELLWATDVHFDHVGHNAALEFGRSLKREHPGSAGLIVTGDIAEGPTVLRALEDLARGFESPLYFVLGNHDYYRSSFSKVDQQLSDHLQTSHASIHWLRSRPIWFREPPNGIVLLGNGGFYDGRFGDPNTPLQLNDFTQIEELFSAQDESRKTLFSTIAARADGLTCELSSQMDDALSKGVTTMVVATHVPPFQDAAFHAGQPSDGTWAPFFSSRTMGDMLLSKAERFPSTHITVLCGHTHGSGRFAPRENLEVITGGARYGAPEIAGRLQISTGAVLDLKGGEHPSSVAAHSL
jgi:Icc protein